MVTSGEIISGNNNDDKGALQIIAGTETQKGKGKTDLIENFNDSQNKEVETLEDALPFLRPLNEEESFNIHARQATDLLPSGKIMDSISLANTLKIPKRKEFSEQEGALFFEKRKEIAEKLGYKVTKNKGKWFYIENEDCRITMQHFMMKNFSGYENGRIVEITVVDKKNKKNSIEFYG